jgi:hypothetical protein
MKMRALVTSLLTVGLATHALAQTGEQRVTITGSSIKRIQAKALRRSRSSPARTWNARASSPPSN